MLDPKLGPLCSLCDLTDGAPNGAAVAASMLLNAARHLPPARVPRASRPLPAGGLLRLHLRRGARHLCGRCTEPCWLHASPVEWPFTTRDSVVGPDVLKRTSENPENLPEQRPMKYTNRDVLSSIPKTRRPDTVNNCPKSRKRSSKCCLIERAESQAARSCGAAGCGAWPPCSRTRRRPRAPVPGSCWPCSSTASRRSRPRHGEGPKRGGKGPWPG